MTTPDAYDLFAAFASLVVTAVAFFLIDKHWPADPHRKLLRMLGGVPNDDFLQLGLSVENYGVSLSAANCRAMIETERAAYLLRRVEELESQLDNTDIFIPPKGENREWVEALMMDVHDEYKRCGNISIKAGNIGHRTNELIYKGKSEAYSDIAGRFRRRLGVYPRGSL